MFFLLNPEIKKTARKAKPQRTKVVKPKKSSYNQFAYICFSSVKQISTEAQFYMKDELARHRRLKVRCLPQICQLSLIHHQIQNQHKGLLFPVKTLNH